MSIVDYILAPRSMHLLRRAEQTLEKYLAELRYVGSEGRDSAQAAANATQRRQTIVEELWGLLESPAFVRLVRLDELQYASASSPSPHFILLNLHAIADFSVEAGGVLDPASYESITKRQGPLVLPIRIATRWQKSSVSKTAIAISVSSVALAKGTAALLGCSIGFEAFTPVFLIMSFSRRRSVRKTLKQLEQDISAVKACLAEWHEFIAASREMERHAELSAAAIRAEQSIFEKDLIQVTRSVLRFGLISMFVRLIAGRLTGTYVAPGEQLLIRGIRRFRDTLTTHLSAELA